MVLIEIVSCLHVQVSGEHSAASVNTNMVTLWGEQGRQTPPMSFMCYSEKERCWTW